MILKKYNQFFEKMNDNITINSIMRTVVLMASHLGCEDRYTTIKEAIRSVVDNTEPPDIIMISYSYNLKIGCPDITEWKNILGNVNHIIEKQSEKTYQFEHYKILSKHCESDDIIMFLDDDDLYDKSKIKIIKDEFDNTDFDIIKHMHLKFGDPFQMPNLSRYNPESSSSNFAEDVEYCLLCMKGFLFIDFFTKHPDVIKELKGLVDTAFYVLFERYRNKKNIDNILMYIRRSSMQRDYR